jgi:enediyne biosynthesis protein E4
MQRTVQPTRSYLSQVELPVTFGLGAATAVKHLSIHWPDGSRQTVAVPAVDTVMEIVESP